MSLSVRGFMLALLTTTALVACSPDGRGARAGADKTSQVAPSVSATEAQPPLPTSAERSGRRIIINGIDFTSVGYDMGSPTAPVVMIDFSDFACPYCGSHARETLPALEREFIATGKVFYKYVPLVMGFRNGDRAARAAECAAEQGKFWKMHDRLFAGQQEWRSSGDPTAIYTRYAKELGLDETRHTACMADGHTDNRTQRATGVARTIGVRATPTFVIDGQGIEGALPLDMFRQILTERAAR